MGIILEIHVILFWVYWFFFFSLMIALMFMDVGDTHDEAIFWFSFCLPLQELFHVNYLKSSIH